MDKDALKKVVAADGEGESYKPQSVPVPLKLIHGVNRTNAAQQEQVEQIAAKLTVPPVVFDGGDVDTTLEQHDDAVAWFRSHMGWKIAQQENWKPGPEAVIGKKTHMGWGVWIQSGVTADGLPSPAANRETNDSNIRWCWRVKDLGSQYAQFQASDIRVSEMYKDLLGRESFDFWAVDGAMRLTAVEDAALQDDGFADTSVFRIRVKHLQRSIEWYQHYIGMELQLERSVDGYAVMTLGVNYEEGRSQWVLEEDPAMPVTGPIDGLFRPRCFVGSREAFFKYHKDLSESGAPVSAIGGFTTRGLVFFHVYDPDGNRFDLSSF